MAEEGSESIGDKLLSGVERAKRAFGRLIGREIGWKEEYEGLKFKRLEDAQMNPVEELEFVYQVARELEDRGMGLKELRQWYGDSFPEMYDRSGYYEQRPLALKGKKTELEKEWNRERMGIMRVPRLLAELRDSNGLRQFLGDIPDTMRLITDDKGKISLRELGRGLVEERLKTTDGGTVDLADALMAARVFVIEKIVVKDDQLSEGNRELKKAWEKLTDDQQERVAILAKILHQAGINFAALKDRKLQRWNRVYIDLKKPGEAVKRESETRIDERVTNNLRRNVKLAWCSETDNWGRGQDGERNKKAWDEMGKRAQQDNKGTLDILKEVAGELDISVEEALGRIMVWRERVGDKLRTRVVIWDYEAVIEKEQRVREKSLRELVREILEQKMAVIADAFMGEWYRGEPRPVFGFNLQGEAPGITMEGYAVADPEYKPLMDALRNGDSESGNGTNFDKWRAIAVIRALHDWFEGNISERVKPDEIKGKMGAHMALLGNVDNLKAMLEMVPDFARVKAWQELMGDRESGSGKPVQYAVRWDEGTKGLIREKGWELASRFAVEMELQADGTWKEKDRQTEDPEEFYIKRVEKEGGYSGWAQVEEVIDKRKIRVTREDPKKREIAVDALVLRRFEWSDLTETEQERFRARLKRKSKDPQVEWEELSGIQRRLFLETMWRDLEWSDLTETEQERLVRDLEEEPDDLNKFWRGLDKEAKQKAFRQLLEGRGTERVIIRNNGVYRVGGFDEVKEALYARARHEKVWMAKEMVDLAVMSHMVEGTGCFKGYSGDKMFRPDVALTLLDMFGLGTIDVSGIIETNLDEEHFIRGKKKGMEAIRGDKRIDKRTGEKMPGVINRELTEAGQHLLFKEIFPEVSALQTGVMGHMTVVSGWFDRNPMTDDQIFKMDYSDQAPIYSIRRGSLNEFRKRREIYRWRSFFARLGGRKLADEVGRWAGPAQPFDQDNTAHMIKLIKHIRSSKEAKESLITAGFTPEEIDGINESDIRMIFNNFFVEVLDRFNDRMGFSIGVDEMDFSVAGEEALGLLEEQFGLMLSNFDAEMGTEGQKKFLEAENLLIAAGFTRDQLRAAMTDELEAERIKRAFGVLAADWQKTVQLEKAMERPGFWNLDFDYVEADGRTANKRLLAELDKLRRKHRGNLEQFYYKFDYWYRTYGFYVVFGNDLRSEKKIVPTRKLLEQLEGKFLDQSSADVHGTPYIVMEQLTNERYHRYLLGEVRAGRIKSVPELDQILEKEMVWKHAVELYDCDSEGWAIVDPEKWEAKREELLAQKRMELIWAMTWQRLMDFEDFPPGLDRLIALIEPRGPEQLFVHGVKDPWNSTEEKPVFLSPTDFNYDEAVNFWLEKLAVPSSNFKASVLIEKLQTVAAWGAQFKEVLTEMHFIGYMMTVTRRVWWGVVKNHVSIPGTIFKLYRQLKGLKAENFFQRAKDGYYHLPWFLKEWVKAYWFKEGEGPDITRDSGPEANTARKALFDLLFVEVRENEYEFREAGFQLLIQQTFLLRTGSIRASEKRIEEMGFEDIGVDGEVYLFDQMFEEKDKIKPKTPFFNIEIYGERKKRDKKGKLIKDKDGNYIIETITDEEMPYIQAMLQRDRTREIETELEDGRKTTRVITEKVWTEKDTETARQMFSSLGEQLKAGNYEEKNLPVTWLRRHVVPIVYRQPGSGKARSEFSQEYLRFLARNKNVAKILTDAGLEHLLDPEALFKTMKAKVDLDPMFSKNRGSFLEAAVEQYGFIQELNSDESNLIDEMLGYGDGPQAWESSLLNRRWRGTRGSQPGEYFDVGVEYEKVAQEASNNGLIDRSSLVDLSWFVDDFFGVRWVANRGRRIWEAVKTLWTEGNLRKPAREKAKKVLRYLPGFSSEAELKSWLQVEMPQERMIQAWVYEVFGVDVGKLEFVDLAGKKASFNINSRQHRQYLRERLTEVLPSKWEDYEEKVLKRRMEQINKMRKMRWSMWGLRYWFTDLAEAVRLWRSEIKPLQWTRDKRISGVFKVRSRKFEEKMLRLSGLVRLSDGLWPRAQEKGQESRINDAIYLEMPHLITHREKLAFYNKMADLRGPEIIRQDQLQMIAEMLWGALRRPQEAFSRLMLGLEHNGPPIVSGVMNLVIKVIGGLFWPELKTMDLHWVKKNIDPSWASIFAAGGLFGIGTITAGIAGQLTPALLKEMAGLGIGILWPGSLTALGWTSVGLGIVAGVGIGVGVYRSVRKFLKEVWYRDKYYFVSDKVGKIKSSAKKKGDEERVFERRGRVAGVLAGTFSGFLIGGSLVAAGALVGGGLVPAIIGWWGVNFGIKKIMRGINKKLAEKNLMNDQIFEVYKAALAR